MSKLGIWLITGVLLTYFIFTSGLVYAVAGKGDLSTLSVPYNFALSGEETGLVGLYNQDDINCVRWIISQKAFPITGDYNARFLLYGFILDTGVFGLHILNSDCYMFMLTWNTQHQKLIIAGAGAGLREETDLPDMTGWQEAYRSGDSVVYKVSKK